MNYEEKSVEIWAKKMIRFWQETQNDLNWFFARVRFWSNLA